MRCSYVVSRFRMWYCIALHLIESMCVSMAYVCVYVVSTDCAPSYVSANVQRYYGFLNCALLRARHTAEMLFVRWFGESQRQREKERERARGRVHELFVIQFCSWCLLKKNPAQDEAKPWQNQEQAPKKTVQGSSSAPKNTE